MLQVAQAAASQALQSCAMANHHDLHDGIPTLHRVLLQGASAPVTPAHAASFQGPQISLEVIADAPALSGARPHQGVRLLQQLRGRAAPCHRRQAVDSPPPRYASSMEVGAFPWPLTACRDLGRDSVSLLLPEYLIILACMQAAALSPYRQRSKSSESFLGSQDSLMMSDGCQSLICTDALMCRHRTDDDWMCTCSC